MEIEAGEFVRTPKGIFIISHINISFKDSNFNKVCICQNEKVGFTSIDEIKKLKHSKNIIDLIEVGDYVNEHKIIMDLETSKKHYDAESDFVTAIGYTFANNEIKSILTHEQYEQNCYRLEE